MKKLIVLAFLLTGCASLNYRIVGWYNVPVDTPDDKVLLSNGSTIRIVGNPRITCFTNYGLKLADGYFVKIDGEYLVVDEFGKQNVWFQEGTGYCTLWGQGK